MDIIFDMLVELYLQGYNYEVYLSTKVNTNALFTLHTYANLLYQHIC